MGGCPAECKCGKGVGDGKQASMDTMLRRGRATVEREKNGSDRYAFRVVGELTTLRAEMAGVLAALQKIDPSISAAIGTDSKSILDVLARFQGRDSPPFIETSRYPDLLAPILQLLHTRWQQGSRTIFYKVRAHRGFLLNELADKQADEGHTSHVWMGEVRSQEMEADLLFTKLDQKGI